MDPDDNDCTHKTTFMQKHFCDEIQLKVLMLQYFADINTFPIFHIS